MATAGAAPGQEGRAAARAPLFRALGRRALLAALLPFVLATVVGNALTLLLLPGADGFFVNVTLLWTALWAGAFFHVMFDPSLARVLWMQGAVVVAAALPLVAALLEVANA